MRIITDRRGVTGGPIVQAAGPGAPRASGGMTMRRVARRARTTALDPAAQTRWDRDEWDVALADGTVYRLYVERDVGQWFLDGVVD